MKVVAIAMGFHGGSRIRAGREFEVPEGSKASWYVPADSAPAAEATEVQEPIALSQLGKGKDAATDFISAHAKKGTKAKSPTPTDLA